MQIIPEGDAFREALTVMPGRRLRRAVNQLRRVQRRLDTEQLSKQRRAALERRLCRLQLVVETECLSDVRVASAYGAAAAASFGRYQRPAYGRLPGLTPSRVESVKARLVRALAIDEMEPLVANREMSVSSGRPLAVEPAI